VPFERLIRRARHPMNEQSKSNDQPNIARTFNLCHESVWRLFYRYLWPFQYFQDVTRGNHRQQRLSYQYNRSMRVYLPGFMAKWSVLAALWFVSGASLDVRLNFAVPIMATCFIACTLSLIVVVLLGIGWLWLDHFSERF
jgi:hypothetical protein